MSLNNVPALLPLACMAQQKWMCALSSNVLLIEMHAWGICSPCQRSG